MMRYLVECKGIGLVPKNKNVFLVVLDIPFNLAYLRENDLPPSSCVKVMTRFTLTGVTTTFAFWTGDFESSIKPMP